MLDYRHSRLSFVLQRRINEPLPQLERVLCSSAALAPHGDVQLRTGDRFQLDEQFSIAMVWPRHSWRANGYLRGERGRRIARVEVEFGPWASDATEMCIRPVAVHPERWSHRRQLSYFRAAHAAADELANAVVAGSLVGGPITQSVLVDSPR